MRDNSVTFGTYKTNRMRKKILVAFMLLSVTLYAQKEKDREVCNSIRVEATDTDDEVMTKAAVIVKTCSDIFYTIGQKKCPMPSAKIRNYSHSHNMVSQ